MEPVSLILSRENGRITNGLCIGQCCENRLFRTSAKLLCLRWRRRVHCFNYHLQSNDGLTNNHICTPLAPAKWDYIYLYATLLYPPYVVSI